jgi:uncharacterized protein YcbX
VEVGVQTRVGSVREILRYPVKSMLGESLQSTTLGEKGIPWDRAWAIRDEVRGGIQGGKKIAGLMRCAARYPAASGTGDAPAPEIELPNGDRVRADDPAAAKRVGQAVEREVTIWPLQPAESLDHYRRSPPDNPDMEQELRTIFAREPGEPLPDLGAFSAEILQYESPPGTYFDAFPLLLLSQQSLDTLAAAAPDSQIDIRRFRPNLLVDVEAAEGLPEQDWIGKRLKLGNAILAIAMTCPRCVMTTRGFADLPNDPGVMRALVKRTNGNLGVYATVEVAGQVHRGDPIQLLD